MKTRLPLLAICAAFATPAPAAACDMTLRNDSPAQLAEHARETVEHSTAIIDAEVITPGPGGRIARLRPIRVLKGPRLPVYRVTGYLCGLSFERRGERVRVILTGGPSLYEASLEDHGMDYADGENMIRFRAAIDALIGTPRPAGVTFGPENPPPLPRRRVTRPH